VSGWLLILALLVLGGVLSTLGDRLGSRVGKARLSLFGLRPRNTAVVITVLTGSLISAVSLGLMLLVSERLRRGLFELDRIEERLQTSREQLEDSRDELQASQAEVARAQLGQERVQRELSQAEKRATTLRNELAPLQAERTRLEGERDRLLGERERLSRDVARRDAELSRREKELAELRQRIDAGSRELEDLEENLIALRRGDVVITSGEQLASAKVKLERPQQAREVIDALLQQANLSAFRRVRPGEPPDRQILLVPTSDINRLVESLKQPGSWVVSIRSAANVLRGEQRVLVFPDLRPNRPVVRAGEVLASTTIEGTLRNPELLARRLNLLLAQAYGRAQRQGTIVDGLQVDPAAFSTLIRTMADQPGGQVLQVQAVALRNADTPDPISVELRLVQQQNGSPRRSRR
jgi:uncharacterized protein (DUF3084 family)